MTGRVSETSPLCPGQCVWAGNWPNPAGTRRFWRGQGVCLIDGDRIRHGVQSAPLPNDAPRSSPKANRSKLPDQSIRSHASEPPMNICASFLSMQCCSSGLRPHPAPIAGILRCLHDSAHRGLCAEPQSLAQRFSSLSDTHSFTREVRGTRKCMMIQAIR